MMTHSWRFYTWLFASLSTPYAVFADIDALMEMPLEGLMQQEVSVASKRTETIREAPGIINIVTQDDIRRYGGRTLTDILQRLPGVNIGGGAIYRDNIVVMRGQSYDVDTQTLILINGRPFRDMVSSGVHAPIYQNFPVDTIDHIEVIRGPGSVIYGSHAFTGVINIVTKRPAQREGSLATSFGSDQYRKQQLYAAQDIEGGHVMAAGTLYDQDGWDYTTGDALGITQTEDWDQSGHGGYLQAAYDGLTMQAYAGYDNQRTLGVTPIWPSTSAKQRTEMVDLGYEHQLSADWKAQGNITYNGHKQYVPEFGPQNAEPFSNGVLTELSVNGAVTDQINLVAGATQEWYNSTMDTLGDEYDTTRTAGYAQLDYRPWEPLKLIAGLQVNKIEGLDTDLSPRAGLVYDITSNMGVKALYSTAYKAPVGSVTAINSPPVVGNPDINPEEIETFDIQWFYETTEYFIAATYFNSRTTDLMDARPDFTLPISPIFGPTLRYSNGGEVESQGIELEGKYNITPLWQVEASLAFNEIDEDDVQNDAYYAPNTIGKAGVSYADADNGFIAGLFYQYFGAASNNIGRKSQLANGNNPPTDDFNLLTANVNLDITHWLGIQKFPKMEFIMYANNLLDEDSYYPEVQTGLVNTLPWQSGRTVYGTLRLSF
jgi:outer membrane receptor for ferrienterochelin and colicins